MREVKVDNYCKPKLSITDWHLLERPREKFLQKGFAALSDAELLAILLRSGSREESAVDLARRLLGHSANSLNNLKLSSVNQLTNVCGIGEAKAISILAAFELGKRCRSEVVVLQKKLVTPADVVEIMQDKNAHLEHEEFWVIYVNNGSTVLAMDNIGRGGLTSTTVDIRLILKRALEINATGIFVCHNHPSGVIEPSTADVLLTNKLSEAAKLMFIQLLDHVIIYKDDFYSFHNHGQI